MLDFSKVKTGDLITIKIDDEDARRLKNEGMPLLVLSQIVSITPAPEGPDSLEGPVYKLAIALRQCLSVAHVEDALSAFANAIIEKARRS